MRADGKSPSRWRVLLRTIFYALLIAFVVGFVIGTLLRQQLERPERYIGLVPTRGSALAPHPGDVVDSEADVLVACHHEEQV